MLVHTGRQYGSRTDTIPGKSDEELYHGPGVPWYVMLSEGRYKYIRNLVDYIRNLVDGEVEELYDLSADPEELTDVAADPLHRRRLLRFRDATIAELIRTDAGMVDHLPSVADDQ